ncbi:MAG: Nucleoside-triphosphatase rdgB [Armatimonadetes bacterium]|jgi:XTP/dITP diphosphohydrolase|nr:Nucleoside-triphosphatase rdgB [Armatimonadota bacterium]
MTLHTNSPGIRTLLIATKNAGKIRELRELLHDLPLELVGADEMPEVDETGATFAENAELKARAAAAWSGEWSLADDSGLEVDALGGAPGVHSNRYWGDGTTETDRNQHLLNDLREVAPEQRTARYRAVVAIASPDGRIWLFEGACEGVIQDEPRGENGFGYDPHFYIPRFSRTMAELDPVTKNRISHRGEAFRAALPLLQRLAGGEA